HPVDDSLIEIFPAQERIAAGRQHFEYAVAHFHYRNIKRAAAQVVDCYFLAVLFAKPISESRRRRLVDDSLDVQPRDFAGVLGGLPLNVVEICRYGDDSFGHLIAKKVLCCELESLEQDGGYFRRRVIAPAHPDAAVTVWSFGYLIRAELPRALDLRRFELSSHEPFDCVDRVSGIRDRLSLGYLANQALALFGERDHRWCSPAPLF